MSPLALGCLVLLARGPGDGRARETQPALVPPVVGGKVVEAAPKYPLRPARGGGYEYDDDRFRAHIAPDGRVSFTDHRVSGVAFKFIPVMPEPHPVGTPTLEGAVRKMMGQRRRPEPPPQARPPGSDPQTEIAARAPRSELDRKWDAEHPEPPMVAVKGKFDLTDEYYRLLGEDPYRREKARFLAATFEVRLAMAVRAAAKDLATALDDLPGRLAAIWADRAQPASARRRLLCGLWAELQRAGERATTVAAEKAAAAITAFVATRLPASSADAYSPAEIVACSEGVTGARFDPYRAPAPSE